MPISGDGYASMKIMYNLLARMLVVRAHNFWTSIFEKSERGEAAVPLQAVYGMCKENYEVCE